MFKLECKMRRIHDSFPYCDVVIFLFKITLLQSVRWRLWKNSLKTGTYFCMPCFVILITRRRIVMHLKTMKYALKTTFFHKGSRFYCKIL